MINRKYNATIILLIFFLGIICLNQDISFARSYPTELSGYVFDSLNKEQENAEYTFTQPPFPTPTPTPTPTAAPLGTPNPLYKKTYTLNDLKTYGIHLLVNKQNLLPKGNIPIDLERIYLKVPVAYSYLKLNSKALIYLKEMYNASIKDGVDFYIQSGFRTVSNQAQAFHNKVNFFEKYYNAKKASKMASKIIAPPYASEHETGLAVDILSSKYRIKNSGFAKSKAGEWLKNNSWKYGFILRYPENKTSITGIVFEPWHFRFIGKRYAKQIFKQNLCLEEYLVGTGK